MLNIIHMVLAQYTNTIKMNSKNLISLAYVLLTTNITFIVSLSQQTLANTHQTFDFMLLFQQVHQLHAGADFAEVVRFTDVRFALRYESFLFFFVFYNQFKPFYRINRYFVQSFFYSKTPTCFVMVVKREILYKCK